MKPTKRTSSKALVACLTHCNLRLRQRAARFLRHRTLRAYRRDLVIARREHDVDTLSYANATKRAEQRYWERLESIADLLRVAGQTEPCDGVTGLIGYWPAELLSL